jgi:fibronectin-binding autotransporter adhesin
MRFQFMKIQQLFYFIGLAVFTMLSQNLNASPIMVCDENSLRAALANGGLIKFGCDASIVLSSTLQVTTNTVLDGTDHDVVISGGNSVRVIFVATNVDLTINNLTIANGRIVGTNGAPGADDPVERNGESVFGGGLFNDGGRVVLNGCILSNNAAVGGNDGYEEGRNASGGAIYSKGGSIRIRNSLLADNSCFGGRGGDAPILLGRQTDSAAFGGALYSANADVIITGSEIRSNSATGGVGANFGLRYKPGPGSGGALFIETGTVSITQTRFLSNRANGGAEVRNLSNESYRNGAALGGAAYFSNSIATISLCKFLTNSTASTSDGGRNSQSGFAQGGAIFTTGSLDLIDTFLAGNICIGGSAGYGGGEADGGAIFNIGSLKVNRSTVAGNEARSGASFNDLSRPARGGGVYNVGDFSGTNNTIVLNQSEGASGGTRTTDAEGGGIFNLGSMTLVHSTVASNAVHPGSSGFNPPPTPGSGLGTEIYSTNGPAILQNTIIGSSLSGSNSFGVLIDQGNNLGSDATCQFTAAGSFNSTDPLLSPLGDFGGPTPTMPLLQNSPAIDHALAIHSPATDQRGMMRPFGSASDIGAFELQPADPGTLSIASYTNLVLHLTFTGTNGRNFQVTTSTNLIDWTGPANGQIRTNGIADLFFTNDLTTPLRFFKAD